MKKKTLILSFLLAASAVIGCITPALAEENQAAEASAVRITALKGPTALGMVELMDEADSGNISDISYEFTIAASADEVTPQLVQGNTDIAAVPAIWHLYCITIRRAIYRYWLSIPWESFIS